MSPVHHVTVQEVDGRTAISFDVEVDGRMPLGSAHEIASGLEDEIAREFGSGRRGREPYRAAGAAPIAGARRGPRGPRGDRKRPRPEARDQGALLDIHDVRVRRTHAGLVVNYHCRVDPALSVDEVHDQVDALERKIRAAFKTIGRIVGHAEPAP